MSDKTHPDKQEAGNKQPRDPAVRDARTKSAPPNMEHGTPGGALGSFNETEAKDPEDESERGGPRDR
ncbi:MAG: hypothetical protein HYX50_05330 [Chloroflexi bacterium]|nr:hypothetical protein [Chloroflexota bacterium]